MESSYPSCGFRIRTITGFLFLEPQDFIQNNASFDINQKIEHCFSFLKSAQRDFEAAGYEVQTIRLATNPFGEWLLDEQNNPAQQFDVFRQRLKILDSILKMHSIQMCSLGPARSPKETELFVPSIIEASPRFSCSAVVDANDLVAAETAAQCIINIAHMEKKNYLKGGLGNFRFCVAAQCGPFIPFFPASRSTDLVRGNIGFSIGLENGHFARGLLQTSKSLARVEMVFKAGMSEALTPCDQICRQLSERTGALYFGIDSSLNPSLDQTGSIASAIEELDQVDTFGGSGSLAAAAAITKSLQSLPNIKLCGYCGIMLPVCEDHRLSELAERNPPNLKIIQLLNISSVCGVGIDTVPIPGDCQPSAIANLILDVAALAARWNKSLSIRLFPVPGLVKGDMTTFDSPYLCNTRVFAID